MVYIFSLKSYLSRHAVLAILRRLVWVVSQFDQCKKSDTMSLIIQFVYLSFIWSFKSDLSQHYVLIISQRLIWFFLDLLVPKTYTMCYLSYWVDCGYILSLKSYLSRDTTLDISLRFILFFWCWFDQWKKQTLCVS